jgi:hypothetical protein
MTLGAVYPAWEGCCERLRCIGRITVAATASSCMDTRSNSRNAATMGPDEHLDKGQVARGDEVYGRNTSQL